MAVVLDGDDLFPDNWIYIHDPKVNVGRIQNFRSWSPWMCRTSKAWSVSSSSAAGDELWETDDEELAGGCASSSSSAWRRRDQLEFGFVERVPKAYPMYDPDYLGARPRDPLLARRARQLHPGRPQRLHRWTTWTTR